MTLLLNQIIRTSFKHGWYYQYRINLAHMQNNCHGDFSMLEPYLIDVFENCPHDKFLSGPRSSSLKFHLDAEMTESEIHPICRKTRHALDTMDHYKTPHSKVQVYMLENDPETVAMEVPIWLDPHEHERFKELFTEPGSLTGHIDVLNVFPDRIQILDYKPKAIKEKHAATQIYFYALMLSRRTGIPIEKFECGYFDDKNSYFFRPESARILN